MFDHIKHNLFSIQGIAVTILHVIFVLGALQFAEHAMSAWHGDVTDLPTATATRKK